MNKKIVHTAVLLLIFLPLAGCGAVGSKTTSLLVIYGVTAALSLLLLGCCAAIRKRDAWLLLLFASVAITNTGYFALALSKTVEEALLANRISYLGSVFLPMTMLMILLNTIGLRYKRWLPVLLAAGSAVVFLIAASPGYLDIYYRSVSIATVGGVTVLQKEYGPWHSLYLIYLASYFAAMIAVIIYAAAKKKLECRGHAAILTIAVGGNIGVWLLEQLVQIDFEFLSVSYIISELFLLGLHMIILENEKRLSAAVASLRSEMEAAVPAAPDMPAEDALPGPSPAPSTEERCTRFAASIPSLTHTGRTIYEFYVAGKSTKEILAALNIKENTLKYHNKNIYSKLGVSSRKELREIAGAIRSSETADTAVQSTHTV